MPLGIEVRNDQFIPFDEKDQFGHLFTVALSYDPGSDHYPILRWYERTDQPYDAPGMLEGQWVELVQAIGNGSDVFQNWMNRDNEDEVIELVDPPSIAFTEGDQERHRTLEFFIVLSQAQDQDQDPEAVWLRLRQELHCMGDNIIHQRMVIIEQGFGESPQYPPNDVFDAQHTY